MSPAIRFLRNYAQVLDAVLVEVGRHRAPRDAGPAIAMTANDVRRTMAPAELAQIEEQVALLLADLLCQQ